jgi:hypothetical protein
MTEHKPAQDVGKLFGTGVLYSALAMGLIGLIATFAGMATDPERALNAYLFAYLFWLSIALGSLGWLLAFHAGAGRWVVMLRRLLEISAGTLPLFVLLFLPIAFNIKHIYSWAPPRLEMGQGDPELMGFRRAYLNVDFFFLRAAFYFVLWSLLGWFFWRWSVDQDRKPGDPEVTRRQRWWSGAALPALGLTISFASIDWVMTLRSGWTSTMFGFYFIAGAIISSISLLAVLMDYVGSRGGFPGPVTRHQQHNVGKLMFAFNIFWTYIAFSQFLLIWMGNLPEEIPWMASRISGGWQAVALFLAIGHFAIPFALLLPVALKVRARTLAGIALWLLLCHAVDMYWLIMPHLFPDGPHLHWTDLTAFVGVGGMSAAAWIFLARRGALAPVGDPFLRDSMLMGGH